MQALVLVIALPLMILNMLGGLVGGVGLAFQGDWRLVIGGIGWAILGPFLISLALIPGMIFAPLVQWAVKRQNMGVAVLAGAPSLIWTYVVVTFASVSVFLSIVTKTDTGFFHILWAYSTTTAPWSFLAHKDKQSGNDTSTTLVFFIQLGTISMMLASWSNPTAMEFYTLLPWFAPFMVIGLATQLFLAWVETKNTRYNVY